MRDPPGPSRRLGKARGNAVERLAVEVEPERRGLDLPVEALQAAQRLGVLEAEAKVTGVAALQLGEDLASLGQLGFDPRPLGAGETLEAVPQGSLALGGSVRSLPELVAFAERRVLGLGKTTTPFPEGLPPGDRRLAQLGFGPDRPAVSLVGGRQPVVQVPHARLGSVVVEAGIGRDDGGQGVALGDEAGVPQADAERPLRRLDSALGAGNSRVDGPADAPRARPRASQVFDRLVPLEESRGNPQLAADGTDRQALPPIGLPPQTGLFSADPRARSSRRS